MLNLLLFISATAAAVGLTALIRHYALERAILDHPNDRSSHTTPTPRGGGVAIVAVMLTSTALATAFDRVDPGLCAALTGGGIMVAMIGWRDDLHGVPAAARAAVHVCAALWALYWLGGLPEVRIGTHPVALGYAGYGLALIGIVWMVNLYNFMDGIDGLAGSQAVTAAAFGALLATVTGADHITLISLALAAGSLGFLVWNWPPARIFMGDAGSGFLGYAFAVIAIASENTGGPSLLSWLLLLAVFITDATLTLVRRIARGERWYAAHRSHAYQRATAGPETHIRVTTGAIGLNLLLLPLAFIATTARPELALGAAATAALLLLAVYARIERSHPMVTAAAPRD